MRTTKAEREGLRALLAKGQPAVDTVGNEYTAYPFDVMHAAVNALPALLDDLDEAEKLLDTAVSWLGTHHFEEWKAALRLIRAYLRERKG